MAGTTAQIARFESDIKALQTALAATQASLQAAHADRAQLTGRLADVESALALRVQSVERTQAGMRSALADRAPVAEYVKRERGKIERRRRAMRRSRR
jgi:hypothetical protein